MPGILPVQGTFCGHGTETAVPFIVTEHNTAPALPVLPAPSPVLFPVPVLPPFTLEPPAPLQIEAEADEDPSIERQEDEDSIQFGLPTLGIETLPAPALFHVVELACHVLGVALGAWIGGGHARPPGHEIFLVESMSQGLGHCFVPSNTLEPEPWSILFPLVGTGGLFHGIVVLPNELLNVGTGEGQGIPFGHCTIVGVEPHGFGHCIVKLSVFPEVELVPKVVTSIAGGHGNPFGSLMVAGRAPQGFLHSIIRPSPFPNQVEVPICIDGIVVLPKVCAVGHGWPFTHLMVEGWVPHGLRHSIVKSFSFHVVVPEACMEDGSFHGMVVLPNELLNVGIGEGHGIPFGHFITAGWVPHGFLQSMLKSSKRVPIVELEELTAIPCPCVQSVVLHGGIIGEPSCLINC